MYFTKFTEEPIKIYGLKVIDPQNSIYQRLPDSKSSLVSADVCGRARTCMGGRIRFRTDSKELVVRTSVHQDLPDKCISIAGSVGLDVFDGSLESIRYLGCAAPENYNTCEFEYGFSGSAKGELPMADIISEDNFRIIIMDYDFNAPNPEFLRETHEPFFLRLREKNPNTPIVLMSRPCYDSNIPDSIARREVVRETFVRARARGDKNTYFIDGELMFGEIDRECCCVDEVHPTDLGHMRIAEYIYPTLKRLLDNGIK